MTPKSLVKNGIWALKYLAQSLAESDGSLEKGILIITFDVETANDLIHSHSRNEAVAMAKNSRKALKYLKTITDRYDLPVTLFCTGHSLLDRCAGHSLGPFSWAVPKSGFNGYWASHDWYTLDTCTDYRKDPEWYFGDLIRSFIDHPSKSEVASNTFSHLRCDLLSQEQFADDMSLLKDVFLELGLAMESHAFPYDANGHLDVLKAVGIKACRLANRPFPTEISGIQLRDGLVTVMESLPGLIHPRLINFGISTAASKKKIFVWLLHPWDIYSNEKRFEKVIRYAVHRRDQEDLSIIPIRGLPCQTGFFSA